MTSPNTDTHTHRRARACTHVQTHADNDTESVTQADRGGRETEGRGSGEKRDGERGGKGEERERGGGAGKRERGVGETDRQTETEADRQTVRQTQTDRL